MSYVNHDGYCTICADRGIVYHHLFTQKARPDLKDMEWNLFPCCVRHHNKFHDRGLISMSNVHKEVEQWLLKNNWYLRRPKSFWQWWHDGANKP